MRLILALVIWFASIAASVFDAYHPLIPCATDTECQALNGGTGDPE